ncbi:MAG: heavy metal translocating P-type ATPase [Lachnospiraceae bacterium]|nr:heavy metal translocating P-type ATPase [Lachnospiraceae bacterium]
MRCRILHEIPGRLRVHMMQNYMTIEEADILESYLKGISGVTDAKVYERTADAVICYQKVQSEDDAWSLEREEIVRALSAFDYDRVNVEVPEHSTRVLTHQYVDRMAWHILRRGVSRVFFPISVRRVVTAVKSVPFLVKGLKSLAHAKLEVDVLDAASILVSMLRGDFDTAGSVMFLLGIGDIMDEWTHRKSVEDLAGAMSLHAEKVWLLAEDGQEVLVDINSVKEGDTILVRTGNMIPLDGDVIRGDAMVNQSSFTGEPLPVHKKEGSYLYAGSVVEEGELSIRVRNENGTGRYDRIIRMIEESEKLKSEAENRASHLADQLVPWTFGATLLTYLVTRDVTRATSILMVDFCCALKLSMPIAVLSAMREAKDHNISVKGGKFMEAYEQAETMVFDKTGTLTAATPVVKAVVSFNGQDETEMLRLAACLEEHYPHSMANAVVREAKERGITHDEMHSEVAYVVAHGIVSSVEAKRVCIGSYHFIFEDEDCVIAEGDEKKFELLPDEYSHLYLAIGGVLSAVILIEDPIKAEAVDAIAALHELGISRLVMMTGDSERTARAVATHVGVDEYHAEVLPEEKAAYIKSEHAKGRGVIMIGDGVNDSPALSEANVGVAINSGAAIAREIADITISEDDLMSLVTLRSLSDGLMKRIHGNYRTIIGFNSMLILLGMLGILPPATSALLHNASTIAISLRSMTNLLPEKQA